MNRFRRFILLLRRLLIRQAIFIRIFHNNRIKPFTSRLYALAGIASVLVLIMEFGFYYPDTWNDILGNVVPWLVYYLFFYEISSFLFSTETSHVAYSRAHRIQLAIIIIVGLQLLFKKEIISLLQFEGLSADRTLLLFLLLNQLPLLFGSFLHITRRTRLFRMKINPSMVFIISFSIVITIGFLLLGMPRAQKIDISPIDILFTAVSATCVTGLSTIDIGSVLTQTGQIIVLILIQIGGLGLMTLTSFFAYFLTGRSSVTSQILMKDLLSEESIGRVRNIIKDIALLTFSVELLGALLLYVTMPEGMYGSTGERIFLAIFHAVSAFCNAGFSLHDGSLTMFAAEGRLYISTIMCLIIVGGLGFPVVIQIIRRALHPTDPFVRFSVTSKLVFFMNFILVGAACFLFFLLEKNNALKELAVGDGLFHSIFYAVTLRTAGFNTLPVETLGRSTLLISLFFMWVGASAVSTGGGIKTSTLAVSLMHIVSQITGKNRVEIFKKIISPASVSRAFSTVILSIIVIFCGLFLLVLIEPYSFLDLAFETVSAFGTVGLSRGITAGLSHSGKMILMVIMLLGRVGILTALIAFSPKVKSLSYRYPSEYVVVG